MNNTTEVNTERMETITNNLQGVLGLLGGQLQIQDPSSPLGKQLQELGKSLEDRSLLENSADFLNSLSMDKKKNLVELIKL
jgi:hypothetical protein